MRRNLKIVPIFSAIILLGVLSFLMLQKFNSKGILNEASKIEEEQKGNFAKNFGRAETIKLKEPQELSGIRAVIVKDGTVINSIKVPEGWPNVPNAWQPLEGTTAIFSDVADIDDIYDGKDFYRINKETRPELTIEELLQKESLTEEETQRVLKFLLESKK